MLTSELPKSSPRSIKLSRTLIWRIVSFVFICALIIDASLTFNFIYQNIYVSINAREAIQSFSQQPSVDMIDMNQYYKLKENLYFQSQSAAPLYIRNLFVFSATNATTSY